MAKQTENILVRIRSEWWEMKNVRRKDYCMFLIIKLNEEHCMFFSYITF